jgi:hypothetical protein
VTPQTQRVFRSYRAQRWAVERSTLASVQAAYDDEVDPDDIKGSFDKVARRAAPTIAAGQARTAVTTAAFIRQLALVERREVLEPELPAVAGTTEQGRSVLEGMAALGPMVLASIAKGKGLDEAIEYGRHLFERFASAEVIRAADEVIDAQPRRVVTGWEGIISPDACDNCQDNAGIHSLDEEMWRHGNCNCERVPVLT